MLGIDPDVRKGFTNVEVEFEIDAECDDDQKDALMAVATKYSAVFDMLANPTEVSVSRADSVQAGEGGTRQSAYSGS